MRKSMIVLFSTLLAQVVFANMDWPTLTITASGTNPSDISQDLKAELYSLPLDANRTVMDFLVTNFSRETSLNELFYQSTKINQHYLTDGNVEYYSQLTLSGKVMALLIPEIKTQKLIVPMLCPCCQQEWPKDRPVPNGVELIPKELESFEYTGIVIDCRNLDFTPSLFPKILNEVGAEIFTINFADPRYVIDGGLILYSATDVYNNPRVGYNPLRITAMSVSGTKSTDVKISSFDARRIHGSKKNLSLLKECRVAIIFGP